MSRAGPIVIIGAGHAGVQAAASLREAGVDAPITLIGAERHLPYERPPLSKRYLQGKVTDDDIRLREPSFYAANDIDLLLDERVVEVECRASRLRLQSGASIGYAHLVFATGSKHRRLPNGLDDDKSCMSLHSLADAQRIRERLACAHHVVVIGAGFIGLEFAAVAADLGCSVDVVELAPRVLGRCVSERASSFVVRRYRKRGIRFHFGIGVDAIRPLGRGRQEVRLSKDQTILADLVVIGIGARANDGLAAEAGLDCPNGIRVNSALRTQHANVSAIGDCAFYPNLFMGAMTRLESVQNAADHARTFAKGLVGEAVAYNALPWFWSDLGPTRLQIAGSMADCDEFVTRGDFESGTFSVFGFCQKRLRGVESLNKPADHLLSRKMLTSAVSPRAEEVADVSLSLKSLSEKIAGSLMPDRQHV